MSVAAFLESTKKLSGAIPESGWETLNSPLDLVAPRASRRSHRFDRAQVPGAPDLYSRTAKATPRTGQSAYGHFDRAAARQYTNKKTIPASLLIRIPTACVVLTGECV